MKQRARRGRGLLEPFTEEDFAGREHPFRSDFAPPSDDDYAEIERLGSSKRRPIRFAPETRAALNESLRQLCGPEGDKLVRGHRKAAAKMRASVAHDAGSLLAALRKLEAATEPGARLAAWTLFPMERRRQFGDPRVTGEMLGLGLLMPPLTSELEALCIWAEHQAPKLGRDGKRGRAPDLWLDWFIILVSDAFNAAGGTPAAGEQSKLGRRESPFLRVLRFIHRRLPDKRRAESDAALDARAARSDWKEWTAHRRKAQKDAIQG